MKAFGASLIAAVTLLVVVAIAIVTRQGVFSPGSLNAQSGSTQAGGVAAHVSLSGSCATCHATPGSQQAQADLCLKCHVTVARELSDYKATHGILFAPGEKITCTRGCHTEHKGRDAPLTLIGK